MMKTLLLTGGIGSGKSFIARMMSYLGVPVYCADVRLKQLYVTSGRLRSELTMLVGSRAYKEDGSLDNKFIADTVFPDSHLLEKLERVAYPVLYDDIRVWQEEQRKSGKELVAVESAIMLEKPIFADIADAIVAVSSPIDVRCRRASLRDNVPQEAIKKRMAYQWSDEERNRKADYIIVSDERTPLLPQLLKILECYGIR